jgi:hypothetical protein
VTDPSRPLAALPPPAGPDTAEIADAFAVALVNALQRPEVARAVTAVVQRAQLRQAMASPGSHLTGR